jgi:hypothetical protein
MKLYPKIKLINFERLKYYKIVEDKKFKLINKKYILCSNSFQMKKILRNFIQNFIKIGNLNLAIKLSYLFLLKLRNYNFVNQIKYKNFKVLNLLKLFFNLRFTTTTKSIYYSRKPSLKKNLIGKNRSFKLLIK